LADRARRELIGIAMINGGTGCAVPFGGTRGVLDTYLLAYAIPTTGDPMVLDMASPEIPFVSIQPHNLLDETTACAILSTGI
jgi:LDH2 family malate/lactate/ureidoglycolate dehydrogenase